MKRAHRRENGSPRVVATMKISPAERRFFEKMGKAEGKGWSTVMREYAIRYAADLLGRDAERLILTLGEG